MSYMRAQLIASSNSNFALDLVTYEDGVVSEVDIFADRIRERVAKDRHRVDIDCNNIGMAVSELDTIVRDIQAIMDEMNHTPQGNWTILFRCDEHRSDKGQMEIYFETVADAFWMRLQDFKLDAK